jgi:hypothetical protein
MLSHRAMGQAKRDINGWVFFRKINAKSRVISLKLQFIWDVDYNVLLYGKLNLCISLGKHVFFYPGLTGSMLKVAYISFKYICVHNRDENPNLYNSSPVRLPCIIYDNNMCLQIPIVYSIVYIPRFSALGGRKHANLLHYRGI